MRWGARHCCRGSGVFRGFFVLFLVGLVSYLGQLTRQGSQHVAERCARAPLSALCLGWQRCAGWRSPRGPPLASTAPRAPRPSVCRLCALLLRRAACCVFLFFVCAVQWWSALLLCLRSGVPPRARGSGCVRVLRRVASVLARQVCCGCVWAPFVAGEQGWCCCCFSLCVLVSRRLVGLVSCRAAGGLGGVAVGVLTGVHRACVCCLRAGHAASECPAVA